jgi:hypothetical protein
VGAGVVPRSGAKISRTFAVGWRTWAFEIRRSDRDAPLRTNLDRLLLQLVRDQSLIGWAWPGFAGNFRHCRQAHEAGAARRRGSSHKLQGTGLRPSMALRRTVARSTARLRAGEQMNVGLHRYSVNVCPAKLSPPRLTAPTIITAASPAARAG